MSVPTAVDHRRYLRLRGPWELTGGGRLRDVTVAYETYGTLNAAGDNAVLVCHALTGDAHVAAHDQRDAPGWWEPVVGAGRALDTRRWFVVCSNVIGGCRGTTGPSSVDPLTGQRYGLAFPQVSVGDMVRLQRALLDALGVRRLALAVGGSLGGMQALEWVARAPQRVARALVFGAPWASSAQAIAWNEIGRQAIMTDPCWQHGAYAPERPPAGGLAVARMLALISYRSWEDFERRFGRASVPPGNDPVAARIGPYATRRPPGDPFGLRYQIESYLNYQGEKLVRRFDANSYLYLTRAMDMFDCASHGDRAWRDAGREGARVTAVGISSDLLYPPGEVRALAGTLADRGVAADYRELESHRGHDAFLLDEDQVAAVIEEALR